MDVFVAQVNPTVGDLAGNLAIIKQNVLLAMQSDCDVIVFPELVTVGYPPRDLLYASSFWEEHDKLIRKLVEFLKAQDKQITVIVGGLHEEMLSGGRYARYNAAWILDKHYGQRVVHKRLLPCYDVFDETRYFSSGKDEPYFPIPIYVEKRPRTSTESQRTISYTVLCDVLICEDIWNNEYCGGDEWMKPATYTMDPVETVARHGKGPLFVLNGSPFWMGKIQETKTLVERVCSRIRQPVVWCNQVGAHNDIITGGYSMVSIPETTGNAVATRMAKAFQEDHFIVQLADSHTHHSNLNLGRDIRHPLIDPITCWGKEIDAADFEMASMYRALCLHVSDYKRRCGFKRAVLGLSGGIDSAVVAVVAADVFGSENVTGLGLPSKYSSDGSIKDARELADALKIGFDVKSIKEAHEAIRRLFLSGGKQKFDSSLTDENIQPRVRGMILMAHSNEYDPCLLLTTGNKSEITIGYCTIYGDMCGGLAVISDVWKTQVYDLARFINKYRGECIPVDTIDKPPSAELREDQQDTDSLPPYSVLDPLLQMFVEDEMTVDEVLASPWFKNQPATMDQVDSGTVRSMYRKYRIAEYKRMQMPPGAKIQKRPFGSGRRMPIAMKLTTV